MEHGVIRAGEIRHGLETKRPAPTGVRRETTFNSTRRRRATRIQTVRRRGEMQLGGPDRDPGKEDPDCSRQDDSGPRSHNALLEKSDGALMIRLAGILMQPGVQSRADRQNRQRQHNGDPARRDQTVHEGNISARWRFRDLHTAIRSNG